MVNINRLKKSWRRTNVFARSSKTGYQRLKSMLFLFAKELLKLLNKYYYDLMTVQKITLGSE